MTHCIVKVGLPTDGRLTIVLMPKLDKAFESPMPLSMRSFGVLKEPALGLLVSQVSYADESIRTRE
jgi:hypothetical protein